MHCLFLCAFHVLRGQDKAQHIHTLLQHTQPGYALKLSLPAGDRNLDDKLDVVEQAGLAPSQTHELTPGTIPSDTMMGFMRLIQLQGADRVVKRSESYLVVCVRICYFHTSQINTQNCTGQDAFLLEPIFRQDVWGFMCEPVSEDNERAVCQSIADVRVT